MHMLNDDVPLYELYINDVIMYELKKHNYHYIFTALDKDIVKGDVNDGQ